MEIKILNKHYCLQLCIDTVFISVSILLITILTANQLDAQNNLTGVYKNYHAVQSAGSNEILTARNQLQFQFTRGFDRGNFQTDLNIVHRYDSGQQAEILLREVYFERYFSRTDLRIGKQKILWGRANGGFITDILSPVDLREFLTQDPEDLRIGLTSINATFYRGANSLQFVLAPLFQKDLLPESTSRWFPVQTIESPLPVQFIDYDFNPTLKDVQLAFRYAFRNISWIDLDVMGMRWKHPTPAYAIDINLFDFPNLPSISLKETYHNSIMGGFSATIQLSSDLFFITEALYVHERLFPFLPVPISLVEDALTSVPSAIQLLQEFELRDDGYLINKPWLNGMAGVQTEFFGTSLSAQIYLETIFQYEEKILSQQYFPYVTLLAARPFLRDRLQVLALSRYNFYAEDFWVQLQGMYELSDGLELTVGTNLFAGDDFTPFYGHFTFSQYRQNSFLFARFALFF